MNNDLSSKKLNIVCYGAGRKLKTFLGVIDDTKAHIVAVLDANPSHFTYESFEFDTKLPETITDISYDYVVITNQYNCTEMFFKLSELGVPAEKIIFSGNFNPLVVRNNKILNELTANISIMEYLLTPINKHLGREQLIGEIRNILCEEPMNELVRLGTFELCAEQIHTNNIDGDVAELGVNKGIFARFINTAFPKRKIFLFDTFTGFDDRDIINKEDDFSMKHISIKNLYSEVKETSVELVLNKLPFPEQAVIKQGWFPDSAADIPETQKFAFVSIDTDLYDPTYSGLKFFWQRLSKGGYIFIHDYNCAILPGVRRAVDLFCKENNIPVFPLYDRGGTAILVKNE
jgi:hypothetical protein